MKKPPPKKNPFSFQPFNQAKEEEEKNKKGTKKNKEKEEWAHHVLVGDVGLEIDLGNRPGDQLINQPRKKPAQNQRKREKTRGIDENNDSMSN